MRSSVAYYIIDIHGANAQSTPILTHHTGTNPILLTNAHSSTKLTVNAQCNQLLECEVPLPATSFTCKGPMRNASPFFDPSYRHQSHPPHKCAFFDQANGKHAMHPLLECEVPFPATSLRGQCPMQAHSLTHHTGTNPILLTNAHSSTKLTANTQCTRYLNAKFRFRLHH